MILKYPKYFIQTEDWAKNWVNANLAGHNFFVLEVKDSKSENLLKGIVYQYPWHFKQNFLYLPKGPFFKLNSDISPEEVKSLFEEFLEKLIALGNQQNSAFIKVDLEDEAGRLLNLHNLDDFKHFISHSTVLKNKLKVTKSYKTIQYLHTSTLDLSSILRLNVTAEKLENSESLKNFFQDSKDFWKITNENIRRYTKKSLEKGWKIATTKSEENFNHFWEVYTHTSKRQNFAINTREYTYSIFKSNFSRIIILKDEFNKPQCVWLGIVSPDTLTYLYGGNTAFSFENYGQYLIHLIAIAQCVYENLKFYDLGGYDSEKGFGKFKEGYRGDYRSFLGPLDLHLQPLKASLNQ